MAITCPECLRVFSVAHEGSNCLIRELDCIYCGYLIKYAIVEPFDKMIPPGISAREPRIVPGAERFPFQQLNAAS